MHGRYDVCGLGKCLGFHDFTSSFLRVVAVFSDDQRRETIFFGQAKAIAAPRRRT
jgi:hypothetical protein